jgi:hypothetical protein
MATLNSRSLGEDATEVTGHLLLAKHHGDFHWAQ